MPDGLRFQQLDTVKAINKSPLKRQKEFGRCVPRHPLRISPDAGGFIDFVATYEQQRNPGSALKSGTIPPSGGDTSPYSFAELGGSPFAARF